MATNLTASVSAPVAEAVARRCLYGVGEGGEFIDRTDKAIHVRKHLAPQERDTVGPAVDIRCDRKRLIERLTPIGLATRTAPSRLLAFEGIEIPK